MFAARRSAAVLARRAATGPRPMMSVMSGAGRRAFGGSAKRCAAKDDHHEPEYDLSPVSAPTPGEGPMIPFDQVKTEKDLFGPGAPVGTVPTDLNQSTGLERLEILGKMQGVDIFDMTPLDSSRTGTVDNPIVVQTMAAKQYLGCTGSPADSHPVVWVTCTMDRPWERCTECGSVYKIDYVGMPKELRHDIPDWEPRDFSDYVRPEYKGWPEGKAKP